jgi:hypothetical protein
MLKDALQTDGGNCRSGFGSSEKIVFGQMKETS